MIAAYLENMSAKEVLNKVSSHLITQNSKSVKVDNSILCMYRGHENKSCAAGCLIPDEEYSEEFEQKTWGSLVYNFGVCPNHKELILRLQAVHDSEQVIHWKDKLLGIYREYGFGVPAHLK